MNKYYDRLVNSGQLTEAQVRVLQVLFTRRNEEADGMSAREINKWLTHESRAHSGVHSRLRELEEILMVERDGKKVCSVSGRTVNRWRLKDV